MAFYKEKYFLIYIFYFVFILTCIPFASLSQEQRINFVNNLSWQKILERAKAEKKYILADCYATWCGPCKKMEKEVFINDSVWNAINANFIAVRVQMDTSKSDNEMIKEWYSDADNMRRLYNIKSYPSFLFISPNGELVHKGVGYQTTTQFISLMDDALTPSKQFYTLFRNYQMGINNYEEMRDMAMAAGQYLDDSLVRKIAKDYVDNYLIKQGRRAIYTKSNIGFITQYCSSSKEKGFQLIYKNPEKVNGLFDRPGFAQDWINYIISMEETQPLLSEAIKIKGTVPDWERLNNIIKEKYNSYYANRAVTDAKMRWYKAMKDWAQFTKSTVEYVEDYGKNMGDFDLAIKSWDMFLYSNDKEELLKALAWTRKVLARSIDTSNIIPNIMDTQANLLYKITYLYEGKKVSNEAILLEEKAVALLVKQQRQQKIKNFNDTIKKMKQSMPTWPIK